MSQAYLSIDSYVRVQFHTVNGANLNTFEVKSVVFICFMYCKFGKDCVCLIFAFFAFSLGRKIKSQVYSWHNMPIRKVEKAQKAIFCKFANLLYTIF